MADPVAEKSTFLCMYMSNHPDTLVAYVKYWGKVSEQVSSARMTSIDREGMTLRYKVKGKGDAESDVRVIFDPPLVGYEEVKPRLLSMTADAQESLGMSKAPQITTFEFPLGVIKTGVPLALLVYTSISPNYSGAYWEIGQWLYKNTGGPLINKAIWSVVAVLHVLEALYVQRLCIKHRTPFSVGLKYVLSTFVFGFAVLLPFRQKIQQARIDSIMKGS
ncbi:hypothetical protein ACEPAI_1774 [Sanghuangporus weigelae]